MPIEAQTQEFFAFNTFNKITAYTDDQTLFQEVDEVCVRYEKLFSRTDPESELWRINHAEGRPVTVDPELAGFIKTALSYCERSKGLFDITMGAVVRLWNFKEAYIPPQDQIEEALRHVAYAGVHVQGTEVRLDDPQAGIDLGGIAKGYITDRLIDLMRTHGVESGIVNLGGNVAVLGEKPDGSAWNIGIRMPTHSSTQVGTEAFAMVSVRDMSVVTSGIYERSFAKDGTLYHHILDPSTGYPAQTDLLGATIVSKTSLDGDGLTTALIIMGLDKALEFVESNPDIEAVFVTTEGEIYASSAIGKEIPFTML